MNFLVETVPTSKHSWSSWKINKILIERVMVFASCMMEPNSLEERHRSPVLSKNHLITKKINGISKFSVQLKCHLKQASLTSHSQFPSIFWSFCQLYSSICGGTRRTIFPPTWKRTGFHHKWRNMMSMTVL
jgi:hypothetical protein